MPTNSTESITTTGHSVDPSPAPAASVISSNQALKHLKGYLRVIEDHKWILLAVGMLTTILQFWRISYLPQLTLSELGLVAVATTLFTSIAICLLLFLILAPGALFIAWTAAGILPKAPSDRLKRQPRREKAQPCATCGQSQKPKQGRGAMVGKVFLPVLMHAYIAAGVAVLAWWVVLWLLPDAYRATGIYSLLLLSFLGTFVGVSVNPARDGRTRQRRQRNRWIKFLALSFSLYGLFAPLVFTMYFVLKNGPSGGEDTWLLLPAALIPALHSFLYAIQRHSIYIKVIVLGAMCLYIVMFTGVLSNASDMAAAKFRLGMMKHQVVLVTPLGCETARLSGVVNACGTTTGPAGTLACLEDVQILTRIGAHFVVAGAQWTPSEPTASVAIPASEVRAWYRSPQLDSDGNGGSSTARRRAACGFRTSERTTVSPGK